MVIRKARVSPGREDKNKFLGAFVLHGGLEAKDLPFQEAVPLCPGPWVGVEVERWQVVTQKGTGLRTLGKGAGDGWAKGKKLRQGTDVDKEGDDQHDDGQLQVGIFNGVQQGHLQEHTG